MFMMFNKNNNEDNNNTNNDSMLNCKTIKEKQQLLDLKSDIDNSIKDIISTTKDNSGEPNISKLYERMLLMIVGTILGSI